METRRDLLKKTALGIGTGLLVPGLSRAFADEPAATSAPRRFIFMHKGNGLYPSVVVPPSFTKQDKDKEDRKEAFDVDLDRHDLPTWMSPLQSHKEHLTILQGLSGMMCTTGHHTWQSSLGVYRANERLSSIKWATVDFELARLFPSPLEHIELACFPEGGGNARGNVNGIDIGFSARGRQQPNYAFGSPKVAIAELFKSVSDNENDRIRYELERQTLEFAAAKQSALEQGLQGPELAKIKNYADAMADIRRRNKKLEAMGEVVRRHAPKLDSKYFSPELTTIDRQIGHTEILLSALISGMTNVVTFTVDELGTNYTGLPGLEGENINQHDVGHGKAVGKVAANDVREMICHQHMKLIDIIVKRLKGVPEGRGTMFDNTMLLYFPDNGETHHSKGTEYPFIVMAGKNAKLDLGRRYIRLPNYGQKDHMTLGNWYTTILNAYGNPIKHYGDLDLGLDKFKADQTGPIKRFIV